MRRQVPTRLVAVALAAGSLMALPWTATAGAAVATTCTKATFTATNTVTSVAKSTLGGCTNPAATGGSGVLVANFKNLAKITVKITWHGTGTSSFTLKEAGAPKGTKNTCKGVGKAQDTLVISTGTVTSGTGKAVALNKTKFSEALCIHSTGSGKTAKMTEYLQPGTKILI